MCAHHKTAWLCKTGANVGDPRCVHCGKQFDSIDDAVKVVAI